MKFKIALFILFFIFSCFLLFSQPNSSDYIYGIHWYGDPQKNDVEAMTAGKKIWVFEHAMVYTDVVKNIWENYTEKIPLGKTVSAKGHSLIYRLQPNWGINVPHPGEELTNELYAERCKDAVNSLGEFSNIWVIGNEVNLTDENNYGKYDPKTNKYEHTWQPSPEEYSLTYIQCRDKIHELDNKYGEKQIVLMQPVSPGNAGSPPSRYIDGNEFLYRQIKAVKDKSKIDGFALHGYAEPGGTNYGLDGFWNSITEQLSVIDSFGLSDKPAYITEWNKHMPDSENAKIGAKFLWRAYDFMNDWNTSSGGMIPGQPNHNVICAAWFIYPNYEAWKDYSLGYWKINEKSEFYEENPWYSFKYSAEKGIPVGMKGNGTVFDQDKTWWNETFNKDVNTFYPAPKWKILTSNDGKVSAVNGKAELTSTEENTSKAELNTEGYCFSDFNFYADIYISPNAEKNTDSCFNIIFRKGSGGYKLIFKPLYTSDLNYNISLVNNKDNKILENCTKNIKLSSENAYHLELKASLNDNNINIVLIEAEAKANLVNWNISDDKYKTGIISFQNNLMKEVALDTVNIGGVKPELQRKY